MRWLKKEQPRVFLGDIYVLPRTDFKRHVENAYLLNRNSDKELEGSIHSALESIFKLPSAHTVKEIKKTDLGIDVFVSKHQLGNAVEANLGIIGFLGFWRPKIEIGARVYGLHDNKTKHTKTVTVAMPWREYIDRMLSWRQLLGLRATFDSADMDTLLYRACLQLLTKLKRSL